MKKDIFNYIIKPTIKEYRNVTCIDKLYDIEDTYDEQICNVYSKRIIKDILVSDTIKNYKNDVLMTKIQYANALKYYSMMQYKELDEKQFETYEFLCKMFLEDVIVKVFSIYDKTYHILNVICELNIDENVEKIEFKKKVRDVLGNYDKKIKKKVNSIFSRIERHEFKKYRDNISHNRSESFFRVKQDYKSKELKVVFQNEKQPKEIINGIDEITNLINEQLIIIKDIIKGANYV